MAFLWSLLKLVADSRDSRQSRDHRKGGIRALTQALAPLAGVGYYFDGCCDNFGVLRVSRDIFSPSGGSPRLSQELLQDYCKSLGEA